MAFTTFLSTIRENKSSDQNSLAVGKIAMHYVEARLVLVLSTLPMMYNCKKSKMIKFSRIFQACFRGYNRPSSLPSLLCADRENFRFQTCFLLQKVPSWCLFFSLHDAFNIWILIQNCWSRIKMPPDFKVGFRLSSHVLFSMWYSLLLGMFAGYFSSCWQKK